MLAFAFGAVLFLLLLQALGWVLGVLVGVVFVPIVLVGRALRTRREEPAGFLRAAEAVARKATAEGASWEEVKRRVARLR
jgi:hypothetical protein